MPGGEPKLSDEALDRLAQRLFAEVRAENPEPEPETAAERVIDGLEGGLLDWLSDDGDAGDAGAD